MAIQPMFTAIVKKGKLLVRNETDFNAFLWKLKDGEEVRIKIVRKRKDRSSKQNGWYWGVVLPVIAQETGHIAEELHEIFKRMFLVPHETEYRGRRIRLPGSTAALSSMEFSEYIERVRAEAAQLGINVPDPE